MSVPAAPHDVPPAFARLLGGFGRLLITVGVLLLLFAGFQLWGTGVAESRAQDDLQQRFERSLAEVQTVAESSVSESSIFQPAPLEETPTLRVDLSAADGPAGAVPADDVPITRPVVSPVNLEVGDPVGVIDIPAIGVTKTVVEGTSRDVLRSGPGHYRSTPLPGGVGNTAIAGHRTTHGAPFFDIDLLEPGDEITVETLDGTATYLVEGHQDDSGAEVGHLIVDPSEVGVIADKGDNRLTLTACHPKYSAKQRIIVTATMIDGPAQAADPLPPAAPEPVAISEPVLAEPKPPVKIDVDAGPDLAFGDPALGDPAFGDGTSVDDQALVAASLGWQPQYAPATVLWAVVTALIALAGWTVGRIWRRFPAYAMTAPPMLLTLFYCFANLEKFIPAV